MKTYLLKLQSLGVGVGLKLGAVMVLSMFAWTTASAQVALTKHNLGSTGVVTTPIGNTYDGTTEVCVFCHTPHGADSSAAVPLWNKNLALQTGPYVTYDSLGTSSLDGDIALVGSVSIACLSCHDGTQAMDAVLNAPGSGDTDADYTAGNWTGGNQTLGRLTGIANLGIDLSDDHPIGIQYGGGGLTDSAPSGTTTDRDFRPTSTANLNGTQVWWVDTAGGTTDFREKEDMQLYTRTLAAVVQPFVECASCHDPHSDANDMFLRIPNTGSAVCLACHIK